MTRSYLVSPRRCLKRFHSPFFRVFQSCLRQRRMATGITCATAGCQAGISANPSSTTQSNWIPGIARAASVSAGKVCTTSPNEEVLINSTRKLFNLDRVADQTIQRLDHRARFELTQAVVVTEAAGAVE